MTKKDYVLLAAAFRAALKRTRQTELETGGNHRLLSRGVEVAADEVAAALAADSARFNRATFINSVLGA
jgi:hypothetical protein